MKTITIPALLRLEPPRAQSALTVGSFPIAPAGTTTGHGFEFAGGGNQCSTGSGTVDIQELSPSSFIERLRLTFSVQCNGTPAVEGRIVLHWVAGVGYR